MSTKEYCPECFQDIPDEPPSDVNLGANGSAGSVCSHLILSRKWSEGNEHCLWYREDSKGYTSDVSEAGLFTEGKAKAVEKSTHGDCVALNKDEILAGPTRMMVPWGIRDERFFGENVKEQKQSDSEV